MEIRYISPADDKNAISRIYEESWKSAYRDIIPKEYLESIPRGYGHKLLDSVMQELKKRGFAEVFLWVLEENHRARTFYEKYGFECTHDYREDSIGGKELREVSYIYRYE